MIRLTIHPSSQLSPEIHLFSKNTLLLGSNPNSVDLILSGSHVLPIHLKITEQDGKFFLTNLENDPFCSLNHHPFGKTSLQSGDLISIDHTDILFEHIIRPTQNDPVGETEKEEQKLISSDPETPDCDVLSDKLQLFKEFQALKEEEWAAFDLDNYLKSLEEPILEPKKEVKKNRQSLKDDYLKDLDDAPLESTFASEPAEPSHLLQAWKLIMVFIFSLITFTALAGSAIYFSLSDKTEAHEIKAAQGMADLAMALTNAKLQRQNPNNFYWADLDFLKANLQAILSDNHSYAYDIDAQGQFNCCPYTLRIYTTSDLSRFLLIAQPAPSVLHWLIPKSSIVIDSLAMELRMVRNVRSLNRLLATAHPLDGVNGKEILSIIKQGDLISLKHLANEAKKKDFEPPEKLGTVASGADQLIYNAPRYYRLGKAISSRALQLSTARSTSQQIIEVKEDVEEFSHFPHLILYSDEGEKLAYLTKQSLSTLVPQNPFLYGYLSFDLQGQIEKAFLIDEDENANFNQAIATNEDDFESDPLANHQFDAMQLIDVNHPIYIQLHSLTLARDQDLRPLTLAIIQLLNQELRSPTNEFDQKHQKLAQNYLEVHTKHNQVLKESIKSLYETYDDIPINQFIASLRRMKLEHLLHEEKNENPTLDLHQEVASIISQMESATTLSELDLLFKKASHFLTFESLEPEDLINYQRDLRNVILQKLEKFILYEDALLLPHSQEALERILNFERIIHPEEKDFFLAETKERIDQLGTQPVNNN